MKTRKVKIDYYKGNGLKFVVYVGKHQRCLGLLDKETREILRLLSRIELEVIIMKACLGFVEIHGEMRAKEIARLVNKGLWGDLEHLEGGG